MPYELEQISPRRYSVMNTNTGQLHSKHTSKKKAEAQIRLLNGIEHGMKVKGGKITDMEYKKPINLRKLTKGGKLSNEDLKAFVDASYKKKSDAKHIKGYDLDESISTKRDKIYVNHTTGDVKHVITGTEGTLGDWSGNLHMLTGTHKYTNRHKNSEDIQRKANEKYGKKVDVVGHSKSGQIALDLQKSGLSGESTVLNPAIFGSSEGVDVVKSNADLVSALTKTKPTDTVIETKRKWYDPRRYTTDLIKEHGTSILGGVFHQLHRQHYLNNGFGNYSGDFRRNL